MFYGGHNYQNKIEYDKQYNLSNHRKTTHILVLNK